MKKVDFDGINTLLQESYLEFVKGMPINDVEYDNSHDFHVDVSDIRANLYDTTPFTLDVTEQQKLLNNFAEYINKISLGNLQAVRCTCNHNLTENSYISIVSFSIAYEKAYKS